MILQKLCYTNEAQALANRFEFHFTPKSASWLNMIEIEFSTLTRLCLDRRIPSQDLLEREVLSLVAQKDHLAVLCASRSFQTQFALC